MKTSKDWLKIVINGEFVQLHVNLLTYLIQKTTAAADDDDELNVMVIGEN